MKQEIHHRRSKISQMSGVFARQLSRCLDEKHVEFGGKLTVTIHPLKDGSAGGSFVIAERPNGEKLLQTGQSTEP
jgi:hypothetical protein